MSSGGCPKGGYCWCHQLVCREPTSQKVSKDEISENTKVLLGGSFLVIGLIVAVNETRNLFSFERQKH